MLLNEKQASYDVVIAELTEQLSKASASMKNWEVIRRAEGVGEQNDNNNKMTKKKSQK
jgi:hypothetical protein